MSNLSKNILVVEDEEMLRDWLSLHLSQQGYNVILAANAKELRSVFKDNETDLVLLDLGLPDADGIEIAEEIRSFSNVPIIVLTGRRRKEDRLTALGVGADDYLVKPCDPEELILRVGNILKRSEKADFYTPQSAPPKTKSKFVIRAALFIVILAAIAGGIYFGTVKYQAGSSVNYTNSNWPFSSKCPTPPNVSWWVNTTHFSMVQYVNNKHRGDWNPYLDTWVNQYNKLRDVYGRNSTVRTKDGTRLSGEILKEHIGKIETRISVIRCLSQESKAQIKNN